jgi:hypothetical protein
MRQLLLVFLCLGAVCAFGQSPAQTLETLANKRVDFARQQVEKLTDLVQSGAVARVRLEEAQRDLADAEDDALLARTLYGDPLAKDLNDQIADQMVNAATRRVERQQARIDQVQKLIDAGIATQSSLTTLEMELAMRRSSLNLAQSRVRVMTEMLALAKLEQSIANLPAGNANEDSVQGSMEHYMGTGNFVAARDLKPLVKAFAKKFDHPLPISAEGETSLHKSLGLDHRGRVDVAINPVDAEGVWLRDYLKIRRIPYYAFTHAMPGKATAAHIHIGPGSTRLPATAD